jgi:hypothetical protein
MYAVKYIQRCEDYIKYNLCIACSLFKMRSSYRDFSQYINDFNRIIYRIPRTAYIRLYVDASVLNDKHFINLLNKNIPSLEIILFEFPEFIGNSTTESYYHDGTVGTMGRFLALYNIPALPSNIEYIWVSDVDMPSYIFTFDNILEMRKNKAQLSYYSKSCYIKEWANYKLEFPILAGKIITKTSVKYDIELFNQFMKDVLSKKYNELKIKILDRLTQIKGGHYMRNEDVEYFSYGFDELFTNHYLIKDIEKHKRLIYYDIIFKEIGYMYDIPLFKDMNKVDTNLWRGIDRKKNHRELLSISKQIYDMIPEKNRCLTEFNKYKNKTVVNNQVWGLTTLVVKN